MLYVMHECNGIHERWDGMMYLYLACYIPQNLALDYTWHEIQAAHVTEEKKARMVKPS